MDAPIALLVEEGGARLPLSNVSIVAEGTAWHALEAAHVENKTRCELAAAYRLFHMYGLAPFDGESINFIAARIPGSDMFLLNDYTLLWEEITSSSLLRIPLYEANRVGAEDGQPGAPQSTNQRSLHRGRDSGVPEPIRRAMLLTLSHSRHLHGRLAQGRAATPLSSGHHARQHGGSFPFRLLPRRARDGAAHGW
jgi:hypothetical protein